MSASARAVGVAVGIVVRQVGVGAAAGRDERQAGAVVGVVAQAAVLRRRADRDDPLRLGRVGELAVLLVAGRRDDEHVVAMRVVDRADQLGDRRGLDGAGGELEAEVDDLRVVVDGVVDALGDRRGVAVALRVEHADRHQPTP